MILDHLLRAVRGVKRVRNQYPSRAPIWPSIQPCARAPSTASCLVTLGVVAPFFGNLSQTPGAFAGCAASHFSHARCDEKCKIGRSSLDTAPIVVGAGRLRQNVLVGPNQSFPSLRCEATASRRRGPAWPTPAGHTLPWRRYFGCQSSAADRRFVLAYNWAKGPGRSRTPRTNASVLQL